MKKLLLLFIALITLSSVSYSSFPITENNTVLTTTNFEIEDEEEEEDPKWWILIYILNFIIVVGGLFLLFRAWWRAWRDGVRWVRKLTKVLMWLVIVFIALSLIAAYTDFGFGSGMGG